MKHEQYEVNKVPYSNLVYAALEFSAQIEIIISGFGTPGWNRTNGQKLRSLLLYPLSYRGVDTSIAENKRTLHRSILVWCGRRESNSHRLLGRQAY